MFRISIEDSYFSEQCSYSVTYSYMARATPVCWPPNGEQMWWKVHSCNYRPPQPPPSQVWRGHTSCFMRVLLQPWPHGFTGSHLLWGMSGVMRLSFPLNTAGSVSNLILALNHFQSDTSNNFVLTFSKDTTNYKLQEILSSTSPFSV